MSVRSWKRGGHDDGEGGRDGDALEDVNEYFDKSIIKDQFELAMRMAEVARSTSEWHRRMTSENLGLSDTVYLSSSIFSCYYTLLVLQHTLDIYYRYIAYTI